ncbi:MAG TPA: LacI family DNA-binding transcriptional regulator [Galbitalea sp.]
MADKTGNPTLYDVAQAAGVSLATASRSLNGSERKVNESYRVRVLAAAEKLGYTPNLSAQAVARGASSTVALLVSDVADPYFSSIAAGVVRASAAQGLMVTMAATDRDADREIQLVRVMRGQRPQIIVIAGSRFVDDPTRDALVAELTAFSQSGGRVVVISQDELPFDTVMVDNRAGASQLAGELLGLGYTRFGILSGPANLLTARDRSEAFTARLAADGISPVVVQDGEFTRDGGYAAMNRVIDGGGVAGTGVRGLDGVDGVDGVGGVGGLEIVFAVTDVMAIGAMTALRERGISVPSQVAVVGFDDIPSAQDAYPALTTVRVPLEAAGERAIELALSAPGKKHAVVDVATEVVLRGSSPAR